MKKIIFVFALTSIAVFSQNDKTGIKTLTPNETLEVNGTLRVNELPETGVGNIYNGNSAKNTVFNGQKTVVTDAQGNLGYSNIKPGKVSLKMKEISGATVDLTTDTESDFFVFDGNNDITITLPEVTEPKIIFFYAWGGSNSKNYIFKGTTTTQLKRPSGSITLFPNGVSWNADELTITSVTNRANEHRYSKIEFIHIPGHGWTYVH